MKLQRRQRMQLPKLDKPESQFRKLLEGRLYRLFEGPDLRWFIWNPLQEHLWRKIDDHLNGDLKAQLYWKLLWSLANQRKQP